MDSRKDYDGDNIDDERNPCQLVELGLSCFGCCGFDFTSKEEMKEAIDKNTFEFQDFVNEKDITLIDLKGFKERTPSGTLRLCGICYNLTWFDRDKRLVFCPLHPKAGDYECSDLRLGHCNPDFMCKTAFEFRRWSKDNQDRYIRFIKEKDLDWYDYSILTENDSLLKEFEGIDDIYE